MYLTHFHMQTYPFSLTPDTEFFCGLDPHQAALNVLWFSVNSGEGFIKITGEVGTGKSLLCRKLLNMLDHQYVTAYIPNPNLSPLELQKAFARELGIAFSDDILPEALQNALHEKLVELHAAGKKMVLIVDEAQTLPDASLEALRLLTNLETETHRLLQIVLFAQPELNRRLNQSKFRQLSQRITFAHDLSPMGRDDVDAYLMHRLRIAGHADGTLFDKKARDLLFSASRGVPRIINILSHKAMLAAFGKGKHSIDKHAVHCAVKDSRNVVHKRYRLMRSEVVFAGVVSGMALVFLWGVHALGYF